MGHGSEFYGQDINESDLGAVVEVVYDRINDTLAFIDTWPAWSESMDSASATDHLGP